MQITAEMPDWLSLVVTQLSFKCSKDWWSQFSETFPPLLVNDFSWDRAHWLFRFRCVQSAKEKTKVDFVVSALDRAALLCERMASGGAVSDEEWAALKASGNNAWVAFAQHKIDTKSNDHGPNTSAIISSVSSPLPAETLSIAWDTAGATSWCLQGDGKDASEASRAGWDHVSLILFDTFKGISDAS